VQPDCHLARVRILRHAFEREQAAAAYDRGFDSFVSIPAVHAAMGVDDPS
jgi:hypothetical protein